MTLYLLVNQLLVESHTRRTLFGMLVKIRASGLLWLFFWELAEMLIGSFTVSYSQGFIQRRTGHSRVHRGHQTTSQHQSLVSSTIRHIRSQLLTSLCKLSIISKLSMLSIPYAITQLESHRSQVQIISRRAPASQERGAARLPRAGPGLDHPRKDQLDS